MLAVAAFCLAHAVVRARDDQIRSVTLLSRWIAEGESEARAGRWQAARVRFITAAQLATTAPDFAAQPPLVARRDQALDKLAELDRAIETDRRVDAFFETADRIRLRYRPGSDGTTLDRMIGEALAPLSVARAVGWNPADPRRREGHWPSSTARPSDRPTDERLAGVEERAILGHGPEVGGERRGVGVASGQINFKALEHDGIERRGHFGMRVAKRGKSPTSLLGRPVERVGHRRRTRRDRIWSATCQRLKKQDAQREDIGPSIDLVFMTTRERLDVFGGHVGESATKRGPGRLGFGVARQIEIQEHRQPVGGDEHVRGLDIAMEHATLMRVVERIGHLRAPRGDRSRERKARERRSRSERDPSRGRFEPVERGEKIGPGPGLLHRLLGEQSFERHPPEKRHAEQVQPRRGVGPRRMDRYDMRVLKSRQCLGFARTRPRDLESDGAIGKLTLLGEENPRERPTTEFFEQPKPRRRLPRFRKGNLGNGRDPERRRAPRADEVVDVKHPPEPVRQVGESLVVLDRDRCLARLFSEAEFLINQADQAVGIKFGKLIAIMLDGQPFAVVPPQTNFRTQEGQQDGGSIALLFRQKCTRVGPVPLAGGIPRRLESTDSPRRARRRGSVPGLGRGDLLRLRHESAFRVDASSQLFQNTLDGSLADSEPLADLAARKPFRLEFEQRPAFLGHEVA
jgi:hypothetical protein